jgi:hypothetical protein
VCFVPVTSNLSLAPRPPASYECIDNSYCLRLSGNSIGLVLRSVDPFTYREIAHLRRSGGRPRSRSLRLLKAHSLGPGMGKTDV